MQALQGTSYTLQNISSVQSPVLAGASAVGRLYRCCASARSLRNVNMMANPCAGVRSLQIHRCQKAAAFQKHRLLSGATCSLRAARFVGAAAVETEKPTTETAGNHDQRVAGALCMHRPPARLINTLFLLVEAPVCIITGGARGIGRAIAEMLGATGAKVVCASCSMGLYS